MIKKVFIILLLTGLTHHAMAKEVTKVEGNAKEEKIQAAAVEKSSMEKSKVVEKTAVQEKTTKKTVDSVPTFDILQFDVTGNTVMPKTKIEEAIYDYMGEGKSIVDVESARSNLEKLYQDSGYLTVSVNIPQQDVNKGVVKLEVLEGKVERLRVKDAKYSSLGVIKERVSELEEGKVPHFPTVQQQLATVNKGANRQVAPILRPGKSPGKVEVDLKVEDKLPLHGSLELNDRYSANTTRTRLNGSVRYENLWQQDHSVSVSVQVSPENTDEVKVLSGTYVIPRLNGDYLAMYGVISRSNISAVGDVNVIGNGNILGARYIHPLPLLSSYYHTLTLGADYKDFKESITVLGADSGKTPIAYSMFGLSYDGTYQGESFQTQGTIGANFSVRGLGNKESEFANKRENASPNFVALKADIKHLQKLPKEWSLQIKASSQVASGPLISAEQFTMGGQDSVRGYTESIAAGDSGMVGTLELRTPPLQKYLNTEKNTFLKEVYAYTFVDGGYAKIFDPLPSQAANFNLLSAGFGLKMIAFKGIFADLDFAKALKTSGSIKDGDDRVHFRVGFDW